MIWLKRNYVDQHWLSLTIEHGYASTCVFTDVFEIDDLFHNFTNAMDCIILDRGYLITIDLPLWSPIFIIEMWSRVTKEEFKTWCFLTTDRKCPYFLYDVIVTSENKNQKYMFKYSHIIYHFEANLMLIQNYNRTLSWKSIFLPEIEKRQKLAFQEFHNH